MSETTDVAALARVPLEHAEIYAEFCRMQNDDNESLVCDFHDFITGARWAERVHGILPAPTEGGAA